MVLKLYGIYCLVDPDCLYSFLIDREFNALPTFGCHAHAAVDIVYVNLCQHL